MMKFVTLRDIADKAGVHCSSVSMAMRDSARISMPLKRKVWKLADELGYRVDPLVGALMRARRNGAQTRLPVLGYVVNGSVFQSDEYSSRHYQGAKSRAIELGYTLAPFPVRFNGEVKSVQQALQAQGVSGLIIDCLSAQQCIISLSAQYACVAFGLGLGASNLTRVAEDYYSAAVQAMDGLYCEGYHRIGFMQSGWEDPAIVDKRLGGYLARQFTLLKENDRVPPFLHKDATSAADRFGDWMERHKPDALIVTHVRPAISLLEVLPHPRSSRFGIVGLTEDCSVPEIPCVACDPSKLGALATELLVENIGRGSRGLYEPSSQILLMAKWRRT